MKKIQYLKTASYMVPFVDVFILAIEKKKKTEVKNFRITTHILLLCCDFNRYIHKDSIFSIQNREFYTLSF